MTPCLCFTALHLWQTEQTNCTGSMIRRDQAAQHTSTAASERVPSRVAFEVILLLSISSLTIVDELMLCVVNLSVEHPCSQQHSNSASERADCITQCALHVFMLQCSLTSGIALLHAVDDRIEV